MNNLTRIINKIDNLRRGLDALRRLVIRSKQDGGMKAGSHRKEPKGYPTPLGRNIDKLRMECYWTYDDLEYWSGISKSQIINHISKGKTAYPRTLAKYCEVFSKKLGRRITSSDLLQEKNS